MKSEETQDENSKQWANDMAEMLLSRAIHLDTRTKPPKIFSGDSAAVILRAIKDKKPGLGRRSLTFIPELVQRFRSFGEDAVENMIRRLREDGHIAPVQYRVDGKLYVGYRATTGKKASQILVDHIHHAVRQRVEGMTADELAQQFGDDENWESALDVLVSRGTVTQLLTNENTGEYLFTLSLRTSEQEG